MFSETISPANIYDHVYINEADYGRTKIYNYESYYNYIVVTTYKSLIGILGSFGLVNLYIDTPNLQNGLYLKYCTAICKHCKNCTHKHNYC